MFSKYKIYFNHRVVLLLLTSLLALYLQAIPLTNSLDYEFSALIGLWFFIAGGIFFIKFNDKNSLLPFLRGRYKDLLLIIFIPLIFSLINTFFLSLCPFRQGILFYFFISVFSLSLGILIGMVSIVIAYKHPYFLFFLFIAGFVLVSLLEEYFYPQVFTYNPLIGYFPGTVYDELIEFDSKLLVYRVYNMAFFAGFIYLAVYAKRMLSQLPGLTANNRILKTITSFLFLAVFFVVFWTLNSWLDFSIPLAKIEKELGGRLETEHFILIYPKKTDPEKVTISALHHEFYYAEISRALNAGKKEKIVSLLFGSNEQKKKYIGSANADISKPWLNMVVSNFSNHDRTLKHEIVHAVSSEFGKGPFKVAYWFNPVLVEGIATAVENKFDNLDLYPAASMIRKYKPRTTISGLFKGFNFFGQASSIAYVYSGAFIKYLIEKYGIENFKLLYTDPDFIKYYGKDIATLEGEFNNFIDSKSFEYNPNSAILYFAGKPVFMKKCPRYAAYGMKKGNEYYIAKDYNNSVKMYKDIYSISESNSALTGIISSMIKLKQDKEALHFLESEINKFAATTSFFSLQIMLADLYVRNGRYDKAGEIYELVIKENPHYEYVFNTSVKLSILREGNNLIKNYVEGDINEKTKIILESNAIEPIFKVFWLTESGENSEGKVIDLLNTIATYQVKDGLELYILSTISSYLKDKGRFTEACKLAVLCSNYLAADNRIKDLLDENLKKINYFINFRSTIKGKFQIFNEQ